MRRRVRLYHRADDRTKRPRQLGHGKTGGESADFSTITGDTVTFNADGTAGQSRHHRRREDQVTGLPANTGYTITESGDTASSYTTT
ncbi:MAG: hypothetical protein ACLUFT_10255 [Gemmiger formicilis]|uniref:hypothetical protein n=1 Tax=Gemmiger formicilis TaxID=745368 RepID=UPI0039953D33